MGFRQENSLRANFYIRAVLANFGWETPDIRKKHNEPFQNGFFFFERILVKNVKWLKRNRALFDGGLDNHKMVV